MKKVFLTVLVIMASCCYANAQKGLQIDSLFQGFLVPKSNVSESEVIGKKLDPYHLDYFRSIRFKANRAQIDQVIKWLNEDSSKAIDKESDSSAGVLTYLLLRLQKSPGSDALVTNQYIGYQLKPVSEVYTVHEKDGTSVSNVTSSIEKEAYVTVVYLKGPATVDDLRKMFKQK